MEPPEHAPLSAQRNLNLLVTNWRSTELETKRRNQSDVEGNRGISVDIKCLLKLSPENGPCKENMQSASVRAGEGAAGEGLMER